jgi:Protein of unknown function (DUF3606)
MPTFNPKAIEAIADAWASIDGKDEAFRAGKSAKSLNDEPGGYYSGYMSHAAELSKRLLMRGFIVVAHRSDAEVQARTTPPGTLREPAEINFSREGRFFMGRPKKLTTRGRKQDRARVAGGQEYEVRYAAKKTDRSKSAMKRAVKKVGNTRKKVEKRLGR